MEDYEAKRLENLKQKEQLLAQLNLDSALITKKAKADPSTKPPTKKRRLNTSAPARSSARIASSASKPSYTTDNDKQNPLSPQWRSSKKPKPRSAAKRTDSITPNEALPSNLISTNNKDISAIRAGWTNWTPSAPAPSRDDSGTFHFASHPAFQPNKSPPEILREGAFGGSYWRPLRSRTLGCTVADDWRELPAAWVEDVAGGLDVRRYLLNGGYDATANKFGVACGQSIEEWEAAGWIAHEWDVRGWFQWYCRFFQGRRCADDARQVGRWARCVGVRGRWRRMLLRKYVQMGVREVFDDGGDEQSVEVSPVMHQTCHHWAWEVRQGVLDDFWRTGE